MISTLVIILIVATFLLGCVAVFDDINRQCDKAQLDELWFDEDDVDEDIAA